VIGCLSPAAWFDSSFALPAPVLKNLPLLAVIYKAWLWRINKVKLYRPATGEQDAWPGLASALTRPIRWDRVAEQYDQMVKYTTVIRTGTVSIEAILRRFMKANVAHPPTRR
jgi:TnpA family transposase